MSIAFTSQEEFEICENESFSDVVRPPLADSAKGHFCSMQAAVVCFNSECEAFLCILHAQRYDECQQGNVAHQIDAPPKISKQLAEMRCFFNRASLGSSKRSYAKLHCNWISGHQECKAYGHQWILISQWLLSWLSPTGLVTN